MYLNQITPLWSDDYVYSFVFDGKYYYDNSFTQRLAGLRDIIDSQIAHYSSVNGRFTAHTLVQLFLLNGKGWVWSLANTACLMLVVWMMMTLVIPRPQRKLYSYLLSLCLFWLLLPCPGTLVFWVSGSCGYLWAALLLLLYLNLWHAPWNPAYSWLVFPFAFLAGNSNEALSAGLAGSMFLWTLFHTKVLTRWQWIALFAFCAGVLSNLLAPGNAIRLDYSGAPSDFLAKVARFIYAFKWMVDSIHLIVPFLILLVAALGSWFICRSKRCPFYIPLAAVLCLIAVAYSHKFTFRSTFGLTFFSLLTLWPVFLAFTEALPRWLRCGAFILLSGLTALTFHDAYVAIKGYAAWEASIMDAGRKGASRVVSDYSWHRPIPSIRRVMPSVPYLGDRRYTEATHLSINPLLIHTRALAAYFDSQPYGIMPSWIHATLNNISPAAYAPLAVGDFKRVAPGVLIVRVPNATSALYANLCRTPDTSSSSPFHQLELRANGYVIRPADFYAERADDGSCFMMVPEPPHPGSEYRIYVFQGHERSIWKLDASRDKGRVETLSN